MTDSRAATYVDEYGDQSWELDALEPTVIRDLIRDAVMRVRDPVLWDQALEKETADLEALDDMIESMGGKDAD